MTSAGPFQTYEDSRRDAAALVARVLHRCHIVNIRGNSYRLRRHAELSNAIHPTAARAVSAQDSGAGTREAYGDQVRPR